MIIYGTRATEIAKEPITDKCYACGSQNSQDIYVFQRYAHIFWIPFFPIGKTGAAQCRHCQQVVQSKAMPPALKDSYDRIKSQSKAPIWIFSGLALVAVLITIGVISDKNKDQRNAKLIQQPHSGDVFEIKTKNNQFTLYKVDEVAGDSVIVRVHNYETNKSTGLDELKDKGDTAYAQEQYALSLSELKSMLEKGDIIDIDRK